MNGPEILLLTVGLGFTLLLAGYGLAAGMRGASPAERLAVAVLAGLGSLLLMVGAVNFFLPIAGPAAWFCVLVPCGFSLRVATLRGLAADGRQVVRQPAARWAALGAAALWTALLWPMLRDPQLVFFDGSGNHDSFFWIAHASYLREHPYMSEPVLNAARPFLNTADVLVGWEPLWGRMGAEGLLALASAVTNRPPLELYRVACAALLMPWLAGVFLVLRTFVLAPGRPRPFVWAAAAGLQPVFGFFYRNDNLPNLLGALMAAAMLVGLQRAAAPDRRRTPIGPLLPWLGLAAVGTHGLLCAYPEMLPFVLLPAGLLGVRAWRVGGWRPAALLAGAVLTGFLVNPATGLRGLHGFQMSVAGARADAHWFNMFSTLRPAAYVPALTTLAITTGESLGRVWGGALSLTLLGALVLTVRRARDPFGAAVLLAGSGALLLYTLATGFSYGWQKTTEFAGVFVGALFPAGVLGTLDAVGLAGSRRARVLARTAAMVILVFFLVATRDLCASLWAWSGRKQITRDLLSLRAVSTARPAPARVLVVGESFPQPFFYGMWASYLLPNSELVFSAADPRPGGYLEEGVQREFLGVTPPPVAILVGRAWADTVDAGSRRLETGADYALLGETVRVLGMKGFSPEFGVPTEAAAEASLRLLPPRDAWLHLTLRPLRAGEGRLVVDHLVGEGVAIPSDPASQDGLPWRVTVPLTGGMPNVINLTFTAPGADPANPRALRIEALRITASP